jgi:hypothetical protein
MNISGLKLNFTEDDIVEVEKGKRQLPHRVELIEQAFEEKRYEDALEMLFNFNTRNCRNATGKEMLARENIVCDKLMEIIEKESQHV